MHLTLPRSVSRNPRRDATRLFKPASHVPVQFCSSRLMRIVYSNLRIRTCMYKEHINHALSRTVHLGARRPTREEAHEHASAGHDHDADLSKYVSGGHQARIILQRRWLVGRSIMSSIYCSYDGYVRWRAADQRDAYLCIWRRHTDR